LSKAVQRNVETRVRPWDICLLVAAVAITFVARVWGIGDETAWWDEVFGLWQSEAESFGEYWELFVGYDPTSTMAPVYFLGQFCWSWVFGASVMSLRLFFAFLSCLTVIPLFFIGRRFFGALAGFVACLCFAFALPHIFYAQEIGHHILVSTLGAFSVWSFVIALDKNRRRWWVLHFIVNVLMLWSSILTVFMFAVEGVFLLLFYRRPFSRFAIWVAAHTALLASILLWVMIQAVEKPFWLAPRPCVNW
jgi:4-amino-4-deoxy-L-arabinose transferase-like glycosyltransferase